MESRPRRHPHPCPQPLPAFITDLHSESSLLFLLRARERKGQTDSWGSRQTFARVSLRTGEGDIQMGTHKCDLAKATHTWRPE